MSYAFFLLSPQAHWCPTCSSLHSFLARAETDPKSITVAVVNVIREIDFNWAIAVGFHRVMRPSCVITSMMYIRTNENTCEHHRRSHVVETISNLVPATRRQCFRAGIRNLMKMRIEQWEKKGEKREEVGNRSSNMKPEAARHGADDTMTSLATLSKTGTDSRSREPNLSEEFRQ